MRQNIYQAIECLMDTLASARSAAEVVELLAGTESGADLTEIGEGDLLLITELVGFSVRGRHYSFKLSGKGKQPVAPGIVLEFERDVSFDFERRSNGELKFTNIKGLKVTCALGPVSLASSDMKQVAYKPHASGVTGIAARMGRFGVPVQFKLNSAWKFAGLGS